MRHTHEVEIDGLKYTFTHFPATHAWRVHQKLLGLAGAPLASILNSVDPKSPLESKVNLEGLIVSLFDNLSDDSSELLMKDLLKCSTYENKELTMIFDVHFAGRIGHLWKVIAEQVKFQYADVFQDLVARISQVAASLKGSPALTTLFGPSGDASSAKSRTSRK